jgi:hypothetical protein
MNNSYLSLFQIKLRYLVFQSSLVFITTKNISKNKLNKGKYIYYAEGGGGMKMLRGAPKYFLALKGGSERSRYTEGEGQNFSKFWPQKIQVKILTFSGKICIIK